MCIRTECMRLLSVCYKTLFSQTMQGSAFDVDTGAPVNELTVQINFADHHGTPLQVRVVLYEYGEG